MIACLGLTVAKFLSFWETIWVAVILSTIALLIGAPSPDTRRAYKTVFLVALVISAGFTVSLYAGLFESVTVLDASWIDISHSAMILHLKNTGLTDWIIKDIDFGNVAFTLEYPRVYAYVVQPWDTAYLIVYYCENRYEWISSTRAASTGWDPSDPFASWWPSSAHLTFLAQGGISPSTFQNGSSYEAILTANGILKHRFDIEAKFTLDEELKITAYRRLMENFVEFTVRLNNTGDYDSYIYTMQIANVTFYFKPPMRIRPSDWRTGEIYVYVHSAGFYGGGFDYYGNVSANVTLNLSMFETGTTYDISVRTMTNNLYITNVTL